MKTRLILFITFLLPTYSTVVGQDKKNLEVLNGFKKFKYEQPFSTYKSDGFKPNDLTCKGKPQVKCFTLDSRNNTYYKISGIQFVSTTLRFISDKLFEIVLWTFEDEAAHDLGLSMGVGTATILLKELTSLFGEPTSTLDDITNFSTTVIYRWETDKYRCDFRFSKSNFNKIVYNYEIKFSNLVLQNTAKINEYSK